MGNKNNLLYLSELESSNESISLESLFNTNKQVFANWYTGKLIVPFGEKIESDYDVYLYNYKHEMIFQIEDDNVMSMVVNWDK